MHRHSHTCMQEYPHIHSQFHTLIKIHTVTLTDTNTHVHTTMSSHTHTDTKMHMQTHSHMCTQPCKHISHTHTDTDTHTDTHVYRQTCTYIIRQIREHRHARTQTHTDTLTWFHTHLEFPFLLSDYRQTAPRQNRKSTIAARCALGLRI